MNSGKNNLERDQNSMSESSNSTGESSNPTSESLAAKIYKEGQKVELVILRETDLGFVAQVNGQAQEGLLYHSQIFEQLSVGQELPGYIRKVRDNGQLDLILQALSNFGADEVGQRILDVLTENQGFMKVNAKTTAEEIQSLFGVSRKKFKIALGGLYKQRKVLVSEEGLRLATEKILK